MPEKVRLLNDPILRRPCVTVTGATLPLVASLLDDMNETMKAEGGIGLAANQIGYSVRAFILKEGESFREFINPEIIEQSDLVTFEAEGCLSIPGVVAKTQRYKRLKLTWLDKLGTKNEEEFIDMKAFAVQHEMDHLNGKLYLDQFGPVKRSMIIGKHKKYLRALGRSK
jgi:peptide deformylase